MNGTSSLHGQLLYDVIYNNGSIFKDNTGLFL
jgi:hypothetical protein